MPQFEINVCFSTPGKSWHEDTSRAVTVVASAPNGVEAVITVLRDIQYDHQAELVHFIHVGLARESATKDERRG
ncbi:hypothetical protein GGD61_008346 [Bradyrhizobium sp. SBR1B]|nr:hypothetical protein [Bradyrhizobium sp. SBR1B]